MIKKLNNKGMSIIEILLCFILVTIITGSIYSTVNAFSNKKVEEQAKEKIYTYKNLLTKDIEDDIVTKGLIKVDIKGDHQAIDESMPECASANSYNAYDDTCPENATYNDNDKLSFSPHNATRYYIELTFRTGRKKAIQIITQNDNESAKVSDKFYVAYGVPDAPEDDPELILQYPIPNTGYTLKELEDGTTLTNYNLTISNVNTMVKNNIFYLEIRFEHDLLDQRYGLRITAPINMDSYDRNYD